MILRLQIRYIYIIHGNTEMQNTEDMSLSKCFPVSV